MDQELYFHRCFARTNHIWQVLLIEPSIELHGLVLFVEEAIASALTCRGIVGWDPPTSIQELKALFPQQIYFNEYIGFAINHKCAINDAIRFAEEEGFVADMLFGSEKTIQTERYMEIVRTKTRPVNLTIIHILSFAGFLSRLAMLIERTDVVTTIIWSVVRVFLRRFPLEWIYHDARQWAMAYFIRHYEIHNK